MTAAPATAASVPGEFPQTTWWLTRFVILRVLGLVYLTAFLVAAHQLVPLIGHHGLTPADSLIERAETYYGGHWKAFEEMPAIFFWNCSDAWLQVAAWTGVALSAVVLIGFANAPILLVLWALYMSIIHVGGLWYGYGWETQLLETGFLGALLCPMIDPRPFARRAPPIIILWLFRWLIFRIMVGSFLIKWRGDECWRDLTALCYHYETQPVPNPVSRLLHLAPVWTQKLGVLWNHVVEAIVPAFILIPTLPSQKWRAEGAGPVIRGAYGAAALAVVALYVYCRLFILSPGKGGDPSAGEPWLLDFYLVVALICCILPITNAGAAWPPLNKILRFMRHTAGVLLTLFQLILIISGNLSFLNWLTIIPGLACLDDSFWRRVLPGFIVRRSQQAAQDERARRQRSTSQAVLHWVHQGIAIAFTVLAAFLSVPIIQNLCSQHQAMNASIGPLSQLHLVNTYGAFGTVGRVRDELVFEGTDDSNPDEAARWKEYEFKVKPGDLKRRPAIITPYHYRLDWQIWFAAMARPEHYPWTVSFIWHLLQNDPATLELLANNPFPDKPPKHIRVLHYRYKFAPPGNPDGAWWTRERLNIWLPPISLNNGGVRSFLEAQGWTRRE